MIRKDLALRLFDAFTIQRWNDKIRTIELTEMDKHAHKMIIAYCLGKHEESRSQKVNWSNIIKGGFFEFLRRVAISDIKSPIYRVIRKKHPSIFKKLNSWIYEKLKTCLIGLPNEISEGFRSFLEDVDNDNTIEKKILNGAHIYASYWEFQIIKQTDPNGYQIQKIDNLIRNDLEPYLDLKGMRNILTKHNISNFIDLCGRLRFQIRWGQAPRIPKTSVLGHLFLVASLLYLFSLEINSCSKRIFNNFFGGLFHDLPEAVTRDIISPVKKSVDKMQKVLKEIEDILAVEEIYPLLEENMKQDIEYFTKNEFKNKVIVEREIIFPSNNEMDTKYNADKYNPLDGQLIKVADDFAAYLETYVTKELGISSKHLNDGSYEIAEEYKDKNIHGLPIGALFADFKGV